MSHAMPRVACHVMHREAGEIYHARHYAPCHVMQYSFKSCHVMANIITIIVIITVITTIVVVVVSRFGSS